MKFICRKTLESDKEVAPDIVGQFVDTMVTAHLALDDEFYYIKFKDLIDFLKEKKAEAQTTRFGVKFIIIEDFLQLGKFQIFSTGVAQYAYHLSNGNIDIHISDADYQNKHSKPQVRIEYRSHFLFSVGFKEALEYGKKVVKRILGAFQTKLQRIDLATDLWGVGFTPLDSLRFRAKMKASQYRDFSRFNKTTGFIFGSSDFMFRVYNKSLEIRQNKSKEYFKSFWILNGYKESLDIDVWRFETQYRRAKLKDFIPNYLFNKLDCEATYIFGKLEQLWANTFKAIKFTHLSNDEVIRVSEELTKAISIRQTYLRRDNKRKKENLLNLTDYLMNWNNKSLNFGMIKKNKHYSMTNNEHLKKSIKTAVAQSFKIGSSLTPLMKALAEIDRDLEHEGLDITTYGLSKSVTTSLDIYKALESGKIDTYEFDFVKSSYNTATATKSYVKLLTLIKDEAKRSEFLDIDFEHYASSIQKVIDENEKNIPMESVAKDVYSEYEFHIPI